MAAPNDRHIEELQAKLAKKEDFERARQRLQRAREMFARGEQRFKIALRSTRGEWCVFGCYEAHRGQRTERTV